MEDETHAPWHTMTVAETTAVLQTDLSTGLSDEQVQQRLAAVGPNELVERGGKSPWKILWEQFTNVMVLILIVAAVVSALLGKTTDAVAILASSSCSPCWASSRSTAPSRPWPR